MAKKLTYQDLLDAGVHFGHLTRKWNPKMAEYIFMENNGIHLIDLNKTLTCLEEASFALKNICVLVVRSCSWQRKSRRKTSYRTKQDV